MKKYYKKKPRNYLKYLRSARIVLFLLIFFSSILFYFRKIKLSRHEDFGIDVKETPSVVDDVFTRIRIDGKKMAVAITVTQDGPYLDGAAILIQSIHDMKSIYDLDIVALVHPQVKETRQGLLDIGFKIIEAMPPISSADIQGKHLRDTIDKSGCCGALELLKLRAFELEEYYRVLLLDMDTLVLKNIDHLFREDPSITMQFTWDYAMDGKGSRAPPVQGGFLLLIPDRKIFNDLIEIVREGDFRPGTGWKGLRIGWCWGGQTIQGLLSYYYSIVNPSFKALDDCLYNAMDTLPERCASVLTTDVFTVHFTVCQKPWECHQGREGLCRFAHQKWWIFRNELEKRLGEKSSDPCCSSCKTRKYQKIHFPLPDKVFSNLT